MLFNNNNALNCLFCLSFHAMGFLGEDFITTITKNRSKHHNDTLCCGQGSADCCFNLHISGTGWAAGGFTLFCLVHKGFVTIKRLKTSVGALKV